MLAAQLGDWNAGLVLLQDTDDLLFGKSGSFHLWSSLGQSLLQTGLGAGGNVSRLKRDGRQLDHGHGR